MGEHSFSLFLYLYESNQIMGTKPKKKRAMRSVKSGVKTAELIKQNQEILNRLTNDKVK